MSDDEEITYVRKTTNIHYGSLEDAERQKLEGRLASVDDAAEEHGGRGEDGDADFAEPEAKQAKLATGTGASTAATGSAGAAAASLLGNVNTSNEYFDLEQEVTKDKVALLEEFERRRKARQINVSTDDVEVRKHLRQLDEPICLFGEGPAERRRRLKELLASQGDGAAGGGGGGGAGDLSGATDGAGNQRAAADGKGGTIAGGESTWYHEGPEALRTARLWLAHYSLPRAKRRLQLARDLLALPSATRAGRTVELQKRIQSLALECSQVGDVRPLSHCAFSDDSQLLLTASWSGVAKLWSVPDCGQLQTLRGHSGHVSGVAMRPGVRRPAAAAAAAAATEQSDAETLADSRAKDEANNVVAMATGGSDGTVKLWSFGSEEAMADIAGHVPHRVARLAFHPSGRFLGTACYDASWRLWDLEQKQEVLHQEGHAKAVHCLAFQGDGSVACTGGLDAFGRVWDLRTGRCVMFLEGHLGSIYGVDFSPNGYHIASASHDNTCKIWDLRRRQPVYTIPAHTNLVADVKYQQDGGNFLVTASYDSTTKIWSNKTWQPLKTLSGHDGKIMSVAIAANSQYIATTSYDRTFKLWSPELVL